MFSPNEAFEEVLAVFVGAWERFYATLQATGYVDKTAAEWNGLEWIATLVVVAVMLRVVWGLLDDLSLLGRQLNRVVIARWHRMRHRGADEAQTDPQVDFSERRFD